MTDRDNRKRLERAVDEGRDRVERTAEDIADRLGRAWQSVRGRVRDGEEPADARRRGRPSTTPSSAPTSCSHASVSGRLSGSGTPTSSSSDRRASARARSSTPCSASRSRRPKPAGPSRKSSSASRTRDVPVTLYDTKGVELGDSKNRVIRDFKRMIAKSRKAAVEDHIHLLWYCMDAGQTRVQDYDIEIIRELAEEVPVILVFTQTIDDAARRRAGSDHPGGRPSHRGRRGNAHTRRAATHRSSIAEAERA